MWMMRAIVCSIFMPDIEKMFVWRWGECTKDTWSLFYVFNLVTKIVAILHDHRIPPRHRTWRCSLHAPHRHRKAKDRASCCFNEVE